MNKYVIKLFSIILLLSSCSEKEPVRSFYLWKAKQTLTQKDNNFLKDNKIEKLYIRFFDIGWKEGYGAIPKSILHFNGTADTCFKIIPVIYIKNRAMKRIKSVKIPDLVKKVAFKIDEIHKQFFNNFNVHEIQLDCDWTDMSKNNFFEFAKQIKQQFPEITISTTIRLHQVKYQLRTGVPPVDKGILMYYNMGDFKNPYEKNSILNNQIGRQYINKHSNYPLELSVALPIYSWTVWVRQGKFKALNYSINSKNISKFTFLKKKENGMYQVIKDTVFNNEYLRYGDIFKPEFTTINEITEAKEICKSLTGNISEIILFSYSPENTNLINKHDIDIIFAE